MLRVVPDHTRGSSERRNNWKALSTQAGGVHSQIESSEQRYSFIQDFLTFARISLSAAGSAQGCCTDGGARGCAVTHGRGWRTHRWALRYTEQDRPSFELFEELSIFCVLSVAIKPPFLRCWCFGRRGSLSLSRGWDRDYPVLVHSRGHRSGVHGEVHLQAVLQHRSFVLKHLDRACASGSRFAR